MFHTVRVLALFSFSSTSVFSHKQLVFFFHFVLLQVYRPRWPSSHIMNKTTNIVLQTAPRPRPEQGCRNKSNSGRCPKIWKFEEVEEILLPFDFENAVKLTEYKLHIFKTSKKQSCKEKESGLAMYPIFLTTAILNPLKKERFL